MRTAADIYVLGEAEELSAGRMQVLGAVSKYSNVRMPSALSSAI